MDVLQFFCQTSNLLKKYGIHYPFGEARHSFLQIWWEVYLWNISEMANLHQIALESLMTATFQRAAQVSGWRDVSVVSQACVRQNVCYCMNLRQCRQSSCEVYELSPGRSLGRCPLVPIRTEISLIQAVKPCSCSPCDLSVNWPRFACTVALSFLCKYTVRGCWEKPRPCLETEVYILVSVWTKNEVICLFYLETQI